MLPLPTGREANLGEGTLPYVRHRPERTLLYQLIEKYYPVFEAQCACEGRVLPDYVWQEFEDYLASRSFSGAPGAAGTGCREQLSGR